MSQIDDLKKGVIDFVTKASQASLQAGANPYNMAGKYISDTYLFDPLTKKILPQTMWNKTQPMADRAGQMLQENPNVNVKQLLKDTQYNQAMENMSFNTVLGTVGGDVTDVGKGIKLPKFRFDPLENKVVPPVQKQIIAQDPVINLKRDVPITDVHGQKTVLPQGEAYTPHLTSDNKVILKDGDQYLINKNQYQNVKGNAVSSQPQEFAPELKGTQEMLYGNVPGGTTPTKYSQYQLPGGENYREVLIKAPVKPIEGELPTSKIIQPIGGKDYLGSEVFKSAHWDEPNVISHLRLNDRLTPDGKKVTFMEEMQSDWAREGRSKGFATGKRTIFYNDAETGINKVETFNTDAEATKRINELVANKSGVNITSKSSGVPSHPLLKDWQELSIKRGLKDAVDNGSDYFSWTTGEQQAARYNLSKQVNDIKWESMDTAGGTRKMVDIHPKNEDTIRVITNDKGIVTEVLENHTAQTRNWIGKNVNEVIGKGIGQKIVEAPKGTLKGEGLNIGGEWANNLYDKQVKDIVEKVTGGKVEVMDLSTRKLEVIPATSQPGNKWFVSEIGNESDPGILFNTRLEALNYVKGKDLVNSKQQSIRLTPEIKAKIQGKPLPLKQPSGQAPQGYVFDPLTNKVVQN